MRVPPHAHRSTGNNAASPSKAARPRRNVHESPLRWLHAHGHLAPGQFAAGERLRADYERAALAPRVTMRWDGTPPQQGRRGAPDPAEATHAQIAARDRLHAALDAAGPGLSDILWRVVCAGESLVSAERGLGWPSRAGKLVLGMALDRVARHYALDAPPAARKRL